MFSLTSALVLIIFALLANMRVEIVSPKYAYFGEMLTSNLVLEFPFKESLRKNVSLESRNGMYFFFLLGYDKKEMTLLRVRRDLLMLHPSLSLSPSALVILVLSLPARSIM